MESILCALKLDFIYLFHLSFFMGSVLHYICRKKGVRGKERFMFPGLDGWGGIDHMHYYVTKINEQLMVATKYVCAVSIL